LNTLSNSFGPKPRLEVLFVEEAALPYAMTRFVLDRYPDLPVVPVQHYKDVFNRRKQDHRWQKDHPALILAVNRGPVLYPGPELCQSFGYDRFLYSSLALNCPYDCSYCYLQGLYPSAYLVAFVNIEAMTDAILQSAQKKPAYIALSHDTDLLALHDILPYLNWIEPAIKKSTNLSAEVRTKSANRGYFMDHQPLTQLIFAFSLAPEEIIRKYERKTPSLEARLKTIQAAQENGFRVRLCFDPVLIDPQTDGTYAPFYQAVFKRLDPEKILDVSHGFFRMPAALFRRITHMRPEAPVYHRDYPLLGGIRTYDAELSKRVQEQHITWITQHISRDRVYTV
jgi:spore photoproduct lyase